MLAKKATVYNFGIRYNILGWVTSFLKNRKQMVIEEGPHSDLVPMSSVMLQGTVLGPIFSKFLMVHKWYIMRISTGSKLLLFGIDTLLYLKMKNANPDEVIQQELDKI